MGQENHWLEAWAESDTDSKTAIKLIKLYPPLKDYKHELNSLIGSMTELMSKYAPRLEAYGNPNEKAHAKIRKKLYSLKKKQSKTGLDLSAQIDEVKKSAPAKKQGNQPKKLSSMAAKILKSFWIDTMGHENFYYGSEKGHHDNATEFVNLILDVIFKCNTGIIALSSFKALSDPRRPRKKLKK